MANGYKRGSIDVEWWVEQVEKGKAFRKKYAYEAEWDQWRKWMRGEWNPGTLPSNVYFKMIRTLIPRIYFRNPSVSITPKQPGWDKYLLAQLFEQLDNSLLASMGVKRSMKKMALHAVMFGTGVGRQGYGAEFAPTPTDIDTTPSDSGTMRTKNVLEYNTKIQPNMPWFLPAHPRQIVVPSGTEDFDSARWICYECVRPKDDISDDPRLKNKEQIDSDTQNDVGTAKTGARMTPAERERIGTGTVLWEIRDKKSGLVFVMAPYVNMPKRFAGQRVLFQAEDLMQRDRRLPAYPLIFNEDDEYFWGVPDSKIIAPQQQEKNEIRTQQMFHRRASLVKILYTIGSIAPDELTKIVDGNAAIAVAVKSLADVRVQEGVNIPQALLEMDQIVDREVQEVLGLGVNQFGEYAPGSADRSATEANIVNQATMIRSDERRDACADLLTDVIDDMNYIITNQWSGEQVGYLTGPNGVQIWVSYKAQDLRGPDYSIKVDPDSSLPETKQMREQKAVQALQLLGQDPTVDHRKLVEFVLGETYGNEADFLLADLQNTSPQNPMPLQQAANGMQQAFQRGAPRRAAAAGGNVVPMPAGGAR